MVAYKINRIIVGAVLSFTAAALAQGLMMVKIPVP